MKSKFWVKLVKKIECKNPKVNELKKGDGRRHINAGDFKKIVKDGLKYCAWCGEERVTGNRKYCNDICRDNCYAFISPQKEHGLEYHLQSQDFKCADCKFDYKPVMDEMAKQYSKRNIRAYDENGTASPWFFGRLKYRVEIKHGKNKKPEVDHIVPVALGGDPVGFDNHQVLCYDCHKDKTKVDIGDIAKARRENASD